MGHVTDGGLEPEPVASIKGPGRPVNRVLALFGANFSVILGEFWNEGCRQGQGSSLRAPGAFLIKAVWPAACIRRRLGSGWRRNDGVGAGMAFISGSAVGRLRDDGVGAGVAWASSRLVADGAPVDGRGFLTFIYRWFGRRVVAPCEGVPAYAGMTSTGARGDSGLRRNDGLEAVGMVV